VGKCANVDEVAHRGGQDEGVGRLCEGAGVAAYVAASCHCAGFHDGSPKESFPRLEDVWESLQVRAIACVAR